MFTKNYESLVLRWGLILILLGGMLGASPVKPVRASTITVTNTNDSGVGSLRQAIASAGPGDTITFAASLAGQSITLASDLSITKSLTIDGSGLSPQITISGGNVAHLEIGFMSTVTLSDLTIANGYSGSAGGAISSSGNLTIIDSTLKNNYSGSSGGAISSGIGLLVVRNTTIYQNQATSSGGAIAINGNQVNNIIVNSTVTLNQAGSFGGAIFMNGSAGLTIFNSTFARNVSPSGSELRLMGLADVSTYNTIFVCLSDINLCYTHTGNPNLTLVNSVMNTGNLADFGLMDLADNGGPTWTMALSNNSSLIDVGDDTTCSNSPVSNLDQRGVARPQGSHCDIGAYEKIVHYVKWDAIGTNNGTSWINAYTDLQAALSAASSGDEIWVVAGTYKPTATTDRTISFTLKNGVTIYGGFAGTETLRTQRNSSTNVTILSGDLSGNDNANIANNEPTRADNVYHVVSSSLVGLTTVLDGVIITGGNANSTGEHARGGGMWNGNASPTLVNITFMQNTSIQTGGGMFITNGSQPALTNVTFFDNASYSGGGLSNSSSTPTLINTLFKNNKASFSGGGVDNLSPGSNAVFENVTFEGNTSFGYGGAMGNYGSNPHIKNATFYNNHAYYTGGSTGQGGALYNSNSNPLIENATFNGNTADNGGSGAANLQSAPIFKNATFANNWDAMSNYSSHPVIHNSIVWGNIYPPTGGVFTIRDDANSGSAINNSVIQNGFPGGVNIITADPLLDTLKNNGGFTQTHALLAGSPAIDAGNDASCPLTDQRGVTRPQGSHCDIGTYEFDKTILNSPSGVLTSWNNTFSWSDVTGATWYLVQVQAADDTVILQKWYTSNAAGCSGDLNCAVSPAETLNLSNGDHKWRILDYGDYGYGSWTPYTNFNLNATCYILTTEVLPAGSGTINTSSQNCSGGYIAGTVVQLTAVPNSGYTFVNWSGNASGTSNPVSVTMDANKSVTANLMSLGTTLISPADTLTSWNNTFSWSGVTGASWYLVQVQTTDGTVVLQQWYTADTVGCSGDLSCAVSPAETLSLSNGDYKWRLLDYGDYGYGSWTPYTSFSLNAACYALTINALPAVSGVVNATSQNCSGGYLSGTIVYLTAVPNTGYAFNNWSGDATGTPNPISITMNENKSVTANITAMGAALITPTGALTSWNNAFNWTGITGATWYLVQLQTTDDTVILQKWYTADAAGCSGDLSCVVSPAETLSLSNGDYKWRLLDYGDYGYGSWSMYKDFSLTTTCYTLTTNVLPVGSGTVSASAQNCSGGYISGTVVQLTALPNSGYAFASWSGDTIETSNPVSITMDGNKSVTASLNALGAILISPAGTLTSWDNSFSWMGATGAAWYLVQVQTSDGAVVLQQWYTAEAVGCSGDPSCVVSPAETLNLANGNYKWRILDYGDYGYGSWSPYTTFSLDQ